MYLNKHFAFTLAKELSRKKEWPCNSQTLIDSKQ